MKKLFTAILLLSLIGVGLINSLSRVRASGPNLIANPSVEAVSTTNTKLPEDWFQDRWGTNTTTFAYKTTGQNGQRSLSITMASQTDGDAKWYFKPVTVTPNTDYTFSDYYKSSVLTEIDAAVTDTSGNVSYVWLVNVPASSTWKPITATFKTPANAAKVTVYHILYTVGTLDTDNFSFATATTPTPTPTILPTSSPSPSPTPSPIPTPTPSPTPSPTPTPSANIVPNSSLETATNGLPAQWSFNAWGNNTHQVSYLTTGHTGTRSVKIQVSNYVDGDAQWYFAPQSVTGGKIYQLVDFYQSDVPTEIDLAITMNDGSTQYMYLTTPVTSTNWNKVSMQFTMPTGAKQATIYHTLYQNGYLITDDYTLSLYNPLPFNRGLVSVTFDDSWRNTYTNGLPLLKKYGLVSTEYFLTGKTDDPNYMTVDMMGAFKNQGSEIGSHTIDHPDLTTLSVSQMDSELLGAKQQLESWFGGTVSDFASPYGAYNPTVLAEIAKYYQSHRSTDVGFNSKDNFDVYNIHVQNITSQTTPAQVAAWVTQAAQQKTWLVLVYHEVSNNGDLYNTTPADLDQELATIKVSGAGVVTMGQAISEIKPQLP